jgi:hypothetical protein
MALIICAHRGGTAAAQGELPEPHDREHRHRALQDVDQLDRNVAEQLNRRARRSERAEQDRAQQHANGGVPSEQRNSEAGETVAGGKTGDETVDQPGGMDRSGQPGDQAGEHHHLHD